MQNFKRLLILGAAVVGLTAGIAPVSAQTREARGTVERVGRASDPKGAAFVEGKVTSVSASHMTIASGDRDFTFAITGATDILARGASKPTKAAGKGTPLTTFVRSGDLVSVKYHQLAGAIAASEIRVRTANR